MSCALQQFLAAGLGLLFAASAHAADARNASAVRFSSHVEAVFSRLGCNGGTCHGAVKGQNGFSLSLFGADPLLDHARLLRGDGGRRLNLLDPAASLLLQKATGQVAHAGGRRTAVGSAEYKILQGWIASGAALDAPGLTRLKQLRVSPARQTLQEGKTYQLKVEAAFADDTAEDVTNLCSYASLEPAVATVDSHGLVTVHSAGEAALIVRYRSEPALALLVVPRRRTQPPPEARPQTFVDRLVLDKLERLGIPPAPLADDATFLRRVTLDVTGALPTPDEVRAFLADRTPDRRAKKIDELLARPGYAALWTLKFCDLLKAADFGVYADGIRQEVDAPRFQQWVRARVEENIPYDEFVERILTATSREGRSLDAWADEILRMEEGYRPGRPDVAVYRNRRTLDLYWQRSSSTGVPAALQVAHAFLGLRLECAQCHRHPHDVWQQDDLLSFANFFMPVRKIGFEGDNEKKYPEGAAVFKKMNAEAKVFAEEAKKLREGEFKQLQNQSGKARNEQGRLERELARLEKSGKAEGENLRAMRQDLDRQKDTLTKFEAARKRLEDLDRRSRNTTEAARRVMHSEVQLLAPGKNFATVSSPIGTQTSKRLRLLGHAEDVVLPSGEDPRRKVMQWLRRRDNPYFARAIVNRVWAHYFGRGLVNPPDHLSPLNPATHPELLQQLCDSLIDHHYDLKWLHRTILRSRTYQQSSQAGKDNEADRGNYAYFYYRRLPAEVFLDALNQATGTAEEMGMAYFFWPAGIKTIEIPYVPQNPFVAFVLATFGKSKRNAAVQCDCERDDSASVLQVLSLANHPQVMKKIADPGGAVARIVREIPQEDRRIEELFLLSLGRLPAASEKRACADYLRGSASPAKGLQGVLWGLINTREFILQH